MGPAVLLRAVISLSETQSSQDLGWSAWLNGAPTVYEVPGDHFTMLSAPNAPHVAKLLVTHLDPWSATIHDTPSPSSPDASAMASRGHARQSATNRLS